MPAAKRKSTSKSPRSKKAKEDTTSGENGPEAIEDTTVVENIPENASETNNQETTDVKSEMNNQEIPDVKEESSEVLEKPEQVNQEAETVEEPVKTEPTPAAETTNQQSTTTPYSASSAFNSQYDDVYQNPLAFGASAPVVNTQQIVANPAEDFSQPPPPPPPPSHEPEPTPEPPKQEEMSITIEEDHKIYVAPKRRTLAINNELLDDLKSAFKEGGITVVEVQCQRRNHAFLKVSSNDDVENACNDFDDKLISGVIWSIKRRIGKAELHNVSFKPKNAAFRVDEEMSQEVMNYVKEKFHVLRHYSTRDQKEIIIGLETEEEQKDMVEKLQDVVIGYLQYDVSVKEDIPPEVSDDPDSEPFLFASIRGDDRKFFDEDLVACIKKLMEDDDIELKRSNVTANGRFAFFFLAKWEDATKFVEKYDNKIINETPLHFEKGQPKSQRENRPMKFARGGGFGAHHTGGGYFNGGAPGGGYQPRFNRGVTHPYGQMGGGPPAYNFNRGGAHHNFVPGASYGYNQYPYGGG